MKKLLIVLTGIALIGASGCKKEKEEDIAPVTPPPVTIGAVPASFTQKVFIEEFTAKWCGYFLWQDFFQ